MLWNIAHVKSQKQVQVWNLIFKKFVSAYVIIQRKLTLSFKRAFCSKDKSWAYLYGVTIPIVVDTKIILVIFPLQTHKKSKYA